VCPYTNVHPQVSVENVTPTDSIHPNAHVNREEQNALERIRWTQESERRALQSPGKRTEKDFKALYVMETMVRRTLHSVGHAMQLKISQISYLPFCLRISINLRSGVSNRIYHTVRKTPESSRVCKPECYGSEVTQPGAEHRAKHSFAFY
jgi:hypothetical protein